MASLWWCGAGAVGRVGGMRRGVGAVALRGYGYDEVASLVCPISGILPLQLISVYPNSGGAWVYVLRRGFSRRASELQTKARAQSALHAANHGFYFSKKSSHSESGNRGRLKHRLKIDARAQRFSLVGGSRLDVAFISRARDQGCSRSWRSHS